MVQKIHAESGVLNSDRKLFVKGCVTGGMGGVYNFLLFLGNVLGN